MGEAAHITAASPGGPRYAESLTSEQRREIGNAIWLCRICAKLIDTDIEKYTEKTLIDWKRIAEDRARIEVASHPKGCGNRTIHGQSTKILSCGANESFGLKIGEESGSLEFERVVNPMHLLMMYAFYDTCINTPYEDFVFLGSLIGLSDEADEDEKYHCVIKTDCHITHFLTVYDELFRLNLTDPEKLTERLAHYPADLMMGHTEWFPGENIPYRISRIGPKRFEIRIADEMKSIQNPFSTSSLLTLLGKVSNSGLLIIDDFVTENADMRVMRYLMAINARGHFSLDDIKLNVDNAEEFMIPEFEAQ